MLLRDHSPHYHRDVGNKDDDDPAGVSAFRDDHEAALQRADALERDLEEERAKDQSNAARIAKLEGELAAVKTQVAVLAKVPYTRRHESQPEMDVGPSSRGSEISMDAPITYPNDGPVSGLVRTLDNGLGLLEQGVLFFLLASVVVTASLAAIYDKVLHEHLGRWWYTVVRGGTFTIAMFGAAYATHQQRHLAMDLVSRRLSPRGRLVLGVLLKIFTIAIAALLFRSGMHQRDHVGGLGDEFVSDKTIVTMLPIGCALIILHSLLHIVIDTDYLVRGKLPPEKARSAH